MVLFISVKLTLRDTQMSEGDKEKTPQKNNMGLAIAMGGGIGLIFDLLLFDGVGIGISIGAGVGIALASFNKR
jgi:hypothetical protein|tara:strand:+ start:661 stop:879 length:219 start_codon:yes stop_codon:yes gene_type:complete